MTDKTNSFLENKGLLFSIAYNMLGSVSLAEDMVQETYLKWSEIQSDDVRQAKPYLVKMVTNICINYLNSSHAKREDYVGIWLPEPLSDYTIDQAQKKVESYHTLSIGILLLLERLTAQERAIFILREVFAYDYQELSHIFDKTEDNCRQIFKRAKENLGKETKRFEVDEQVHKKMLSGFMKACFEGNLENLIEYLKEDVVLFADGGGKSISVNGQKLTAALNPIYGRDDVGKFILMNLRKIFAYVPDFSWEIIMTNGFPSIMAYMGMIPMSLNSFEYEGDKINGVYIQTNPDKLKQFFKNMQ
jgi:RNA polymerase sigma-70 factor (ECF subfamily)